MNTMQHLSLSVCNSWFSMYPPSSGQRNKGERKNERAYFVTLILSVRGNQSISMGLSWKQLMKKQTNKQQNYTKYKHKPTNESISYNVLNEQRLGKLQWSIWLYFIIFEVGLYQTITNRVMIIRFEAISTECCYLSLFNYRKELSMKYINLQSSRWWSAGL